MPQHPGPAGPAQAIFFKEGNQVITKTADIWVHGRPCAAAQTVRVWSCPMNAKLLMIIAGLFFLFWKRAADSFLLFCALFAAGLCVCVLIYRLEAPHEDGDQQAP
jgi:hypothetical protein